MSYKTLPVVPFIKVLRNASRILKNPLPFHNENFERHGDVFKVQLGMGKSVIFTRDAGFAKHMLQKNHKNYYKSELQTKDLARYIGEGLLTANGEKWLKQRRLIQPAFHKKKLESLIDTMKSVIKEEFSKIQPEQDIDVFPIMNDLAFKVVAKSLFSYTDSGETVSRLQYITEAAQKTLIKEIRQPYKRWWFNISGQTKATLKLTKEARDILNDLIEERKRSDQRFDDLLDMLLEARYDDGSAMDNEQLIDEILILFTAGHETTSNALTFTLLLLGHNPKIQQKAYQEIVNTSSSISALEEVSAYPFTKQCVEEAMRMYPPAYFSDRLAVARDSFNDLEIVKGTTVLISFFEIHRHKAFWKDPEVFNPDRFHPEIAKKEYSDWYFPFGAGPRMCIGNNFAMYEMVLAISELLRAYKIVPKHDEIYIKPLITLKPENAIIKFLPR
ncbi:cytochrome P450 [Aquimarina sp. D1M17]|uniref:cytochrome P450 n=1 Tax=Aquimarina acroporae TaxID=2937283 RepID=UPI0020C0079D|nr:cytochrome P450 [Aquimarina acroporae]MCK8522447.1 cytochrome P450 [Aquimarina acroporae]